MLYQKITWTCSNFHGALKQFLEKRCESILLHSCVPFADPWPDCSDCVAIHFIWSYKQDLLAREWNLQIKFSQYYPPNSERNRTHLGIAISQRCMYFCIKLVNFVVSGNAVDWYFTSIQGSSKPRCCLPSGRLLCKNWGSICGGSFLNAFFILLDSFSDLFRCDPRGSCAKCSPAYQKCCCCNYLFELVRTDAYAYINLTGIPYCNAARQC